MFDKHVTPNQVVARSETPFLRENTEPSNPESTESSNDQVRTEIRWVV
jgi:hypothetical protein